MRKKEIIFFPSKEVIDLCTDLNAEDYINKMEDFVFFSKVKRKYENGRFFVNCIVCFIKGGGGIEKETIIKHDCIVSVYQNIAYIQTEDSHKIIRKSINSKEFRLIGCEIEKGEFDRIAHNGKTPEYLGSIQS